MTDLKVMFHANSSVQALFMRETRNLLLVQTILFETFEEGLKKSRLQLNVQIDLVINLMARKNNTSF